MRRHDLWTLMLITLVFCSCLPFTYQKPPSEHELEPYIRQKSENFLTTKVTPTPKKVEESIQESVSACEAEVLELKLDLKITRNIIEDFICPHTMRIK